MVINYISYIYIYHEPIKFNRSTFHQHFPLLIEARAGAQASTGAIFCGGVLKQWMDIDLEIKNLFYIYNYIYK